MNSKRLYYGLVGLLVILGLGLLFGAHEANTLLENQSVTLVTLKAKNQAMTNEQVQLSNDKKEITTYADLNTIAQSVVPQDKDQAEAVLEIVNLAAQSGISQLSSITFPTSTLGTTTTGSSANPNLTQLMPVKGIPGVYELQITVTQDTTSLVPYSDFITFLSKLEQNRRTAQVSDIDVQPDQTNPDMIAFNLVINEFIKP